MEMRNKLSEKEQNILKKEIKEKGIFKFGDNEFKYSEIENLGLLLDNITINDDNEIFFKGNCKFPCSNSPCITIVRGEYEGKAKFIALDVIEIINPIKLIKL